MKLKAYSLVNCVAVIFCIVSKTVAIGEDSILRLLEEMRNRMCYPLFGLPALDPLQVQHAYFSIDNKYIVNSSSSITDFRLTGLSDFNVTNLKISAIPKIPGIPPKRSNFSIVLPLTSAKTLYTAVGSLGYIVSLGGGSKAEGHIEDVTLSISWILKPGLTVGIRDLQIEISIGNLFVNIENLLEEPRLNNFIHALVNEMAIELMNDIWLAAQEKGFVKYVQNILNTFLGHYTIKDIIKVIEGIISGGSSEEPPFGGVPADCKTKILI